jgi:hypothetical protein
MRLPQSIALLKPKGVVWVRKKAGMQLSTVIEILNLMLIIKSEIIFA